MSIRIIPLDILPEYICPIPDKQRESTTASQGSLVGFPIYTSLNHLCKL
ncbi:MAG: hypothetical protein ACYS17_03725 [Planctomycetota bacterium]